MSEEQGPVEGANYRRTADGSVNVEHLWRDSYGQLMDASDWPADKLEGEWLGPVPTYAEWQAAKTSYDLAYLAGARSQNALINIGRDQHIAYIEAELEKAQARIADLESRQPQIANGAPPEWACKVNPWWMAQIDGVDWIQLSSLNEMDDVTRCYPFDPVTGGYRSIEGWPEYVKGQS